MLLISRIIALVTIILFFDNSYATDCNKPLTAKNYDRVVTEPIGRSGYVDVRIGSQVLKIPFRHQIEWERRLNFARPQKLSHGQFVADSLAYFYGAQYESLRRSGGWNIQMPDYWQGQVQLAPLSSKYDWYHESGFEARGRSQSRLIKSWQMGSQLQGELITEAYGQRLNMTPINRSLIDGDSFRFNRRDDFVETKYWVGWHDETSHYFDTHNKTLAQAGVSARMKVWFAKGKAPSDALSLDKVLSDSNAIQKSVTIKRSLKSRGVWTLRDEIHLKWPSYLKAEWVPRVITAVLEQVLKLNEVSADDLAPQKAVVNQRVALKLNRVTKGEAQELQLGFITFDHFSVYDPKTGAELTSGGIEQSEIEIFSDLAEATHDNSDLLAFLSEFEGRLQGRATTRPKFLHGDATTQYQR